MTHKRDRLTNAQAVERDAKIVREYLSTNGSESIRELANRLGLGKNTVHGIIFRNRAKGVLPPAGPNPVIHWTTEQKAEAGRQSAQKRRQQTQAGRLSQKAARPTKMVELLKPEPRRPIVSKPAEESFPMTLDEVQRARGCRMPADVRNLKRRAVTFCGQPGEPFCERHRRRAYHSAEPVRAPRG